MELFSADFSDFNGSTSLPDCSNGTPVEVMTTVTDSAKPETDLWCGINETYCTLKYKRRMTPIIHDVVPNQIYKEQPIDWIINVQ